MLQFCGRLFLEMLTSIPACKCCSTHGVGVGGARLGFYFTLLEFGWPCDLPGPIIECSGSDIVPDGDADGP